MRILAILPAAAPALAINQCLILSGVVFARVLTVFADFKTAKQTERWPSG